MGREIQLMDRYIRAVTGADEVKRSLTVFIFSGVLERFPGLKLVSAENIVGWLPFVIQRWDQAQESARHMHPAPLKLKPSEYFQRQIYATFFRDTVGGHNLEWWGSDNCMWSNDFPHANSTWPDSRKFIERDLGHLPRDLRFKLLCENVSKLYGMEIPQPLHAAQASAAM